eukprot:1183597-Prorocentrum_minimum.AAC.1
MIKGRTREDKFSPDGSPRETWRRRSGRRGSGLKRQRRPKGSHARPTSKSRGSTAPAPPPATRASGPTCCPPPPGKDANQSPSVSQSVMPGQHFSECFHITYRIGRGRPVLPAAQHGASCPVDHPCRGPLPIGVYCSSQIGALPGRGWAALRVDEVPGAGKLAHVLPLRVAALHVQPPQLVVHLQVRGGDLLRGGEALLSALRPPPEDVHVPGLLVYVVHHRLRDDEYTQEQYISTEKSNT